MRSFAASAFVLALLAVSCQPVGTYTPRTAKPREATERGPAPQPPDRPAPAAIDPELVWLNPTPTQPDVPIVFVHATTSPDEWAKLADRPWQEPLLFQPAPAVTLIGLPPSWGRAAAVCATARLPIKVRVPLGLDDPSKFIPADNPLALAKWQLGGRLFFDKSYLGPKQGVSCAGCHLPEHGFTDGLTGHGGFNTPTLLNCVYNARQFWDGRASSLEEVVYLPVGEQIAGDPEGPFRHAWGGAAIVRLYGDKGYRDTFENVFGTGPTLDTLGKALATYMRTLLCGDALHDRAVQAQAARRGRELEPADYEKVLDPARIKALGREGKTAAQVAGELYDGYRLFHNLVGNRPTNCVRCHGGANFTDNGFHNLGVGINSGGQVPPGRFASLPVRHKEAGLFGAFKTPTLRSLERTGPYFHDGSQKRLEAVIEFHAKGGNWNPFLDPLLLESGNPGRERNLHLGGDDVQALALFLRALDGREVDPRFRAAPRGE
jgi:cytochrome c peroxidase